MKPNPRPHSVSTSSLRNIYFVGVLFCAVFASSLCINSCKSTPTSPVEFKTPDGRSGAGIYSLRPVPGARFELRDTRYNLDSVGIYTGQDTSFITWVIKDTGVTFPSGAKGMRIQQTKTNKKFDTTEVSFMIGDSDLSTLNFKGANETRHWLRRPIAAGALFKSTDTTSVADMHIDSVGVPLSVTALSATDAVKISQSQHVAWGTTGSTIDYLTSFCFVPDYFFVKIHSVVTFSSPGTQNTFSIEDIELITKPY